MGDSRFEPFLTRVRDAPDKAAALRSLSDAEVVQALAAASRDEKDPYLANVLATEAMNRLATKTSIVENAAQGLFAAERDGRITFANPAAERLLGYAPGGLRGILFGDLLRDGHPKLAGLLASLDVAGGQARRSLNDELVTPTGGRVPVDWSVSADVREGDARGLVIAFTDVRERKLAEARLERERQLYELLLSAQSNLGEAVIVSNGHSVLHVNEACIALTGRLREELLALRGLRDLVTPDDIARLGELGPEGEARRRFDVEILQPSGRCVRVEVAMKTLHLAKETVTVTLLRDVTTSRFVFAGLRESERAFRATFERAPVGLAQLSLDGRWRRLNASAARTLGHSFSELHRGRLIDILVPADRVALAPHLERVFAGGEPLETTRARVMPRGGGSRSVWLSLWAVRSDEDELGFVVASIEPDEGARDTAPRQRAAQT